MSGQSHRDPGLQPERTALAWNRTGLTMLVNALLTLRIGMEQQHRALIALSSVLLIACAAVLVRAGKRHRDLHNTAQHPAVPARDIAAIAGLALCLCGLTLFAMLNR